MARGYYISPAILHRLLERKMSIKFFLEMIQVYIELLSKGWKFKSAGVFSCNYITLLQNILYKKWQKNNESIRNKTNNHLTNSLKRICISVAKQLVIIFSMSPFPIFSSSFPFFTSNDSYTYIKLQPMQRKHF